MLLSVVIPVCNGAATIGVCLNAVFGQQLDRSSFEVIVVDDGSADHTTEVVSRFPANLLRHDSNRGSTAARNTGIRAARGEWIAFTDGDCVPSRRWLDLLIGAARSDASPKEVTGVAGRIVGLPSDAPAARFASLTGHLDTERQLSHPTFPYAYMSNVMYRRVAIDTAGGFDETMRVYATPEFHHRVMSNHGGRMLFESRAVVLHRHPETWSQYWRQQAGYGAGYGKFMRRHADRFRWTAWREIQAWGAVASGLAVAAIPGRGDPALVRRGLAIKRVAQRVGFDRTYWFGG